MKPAPPVMSTCLAMSAVTSRSHSRNTIASPDDAIARTNPTPPTERRPPMLSTRAKAARRLADFGAAVAGVCALSRLRGQLRDHAIERRHGDAAGAPSRCRTQSHRAGRADSEQRAAKRQTGADAQKQLSF